MKEIKVRIEGTAPLLQHKMDADTEASLDATAIKKKTGANKDDDPRKFLYTFEGKVVQPAEHIVQAIIKRASGYQIQGKGKKTYKEIAQGAVNVVPEFIPHENQNWTVDVRTAVVPATKGRIVRKRPRIDNWALEFTIQIINDQLPSAVVKAMLDDAGREGGIGDYRPRFGRFIVTRWEEQ